MTSRIKSLVAAGAFASLLVHTAVVRAEVSEAEAAKLKTELTATGAEKAANAAGTIPAWTGGLSKPGVPSGELPMDQFANEKPLYQITAANMQEHAGVLTDGVKALLQKFPTYRIDVYPSHRTFAAPQFFYDNSVKNATRAKLTEGGNSLTGAYGGVPFPIPKSGVEVYWNHTLRYLPKTLQYAVKNFTGTADGKVIMTVSAIDTKQSPYLYPDQSPETWSGEFGFGRLQMTGPAFKVGEALVIRDNVDPGSSRQAWQYLVGQRRVRRAPTVAYDTPDFVASGANYFDEVFGFWGAPDRYDWKLVGKKELLVPYNCNKFINTPVDKALLPGHPNPDALRWELHRVWEVEATLAPGKRHAVPKRRFYFDEDSWSVVLMDGYDAEGKLWRTSQVLPINIPEVPANFYNSTFVFNLQAGTYSGIELMNEGWLKVIDRRPDSFFTGDAVAADGIR